MRSQSLFALAVFGLRLSSQLPAQGQRAALLAADRAAAQLSSDSGFAAAVLGTTHREGGLLWPGAPVAAGAEELRKLLGVLPSHDSLRLSWQPLGLELARDSTFGVTWGVVVATSRSADALPRIGRYTTIWRRDDGPRTIAALLVNGVAPVSATTLPKGLRFTKEPARPTGNAAPFVEADLAFAKLAGARGAAVAFQRWAAPEAFTCGNARPPTP
jgi:hypothetical protein